MRWRFIGAILGVTLLVLITILVPLALFLRTSAYNQTIIILERNAFTLAARSGPLLWTRTPEALAYTEKIALAYATESDARVVITDSRGIALVVTDDPADVGTSFASRPEVSEALQGDVASGERYSDTFGGNLFYVAVPALSGESVLGTVRITYPSDEVQEKLNEQLVLLIEVGLTAMVLAGIVAYILASSVTRPLSRLRLTAEQVAEGDLDRRSDEKSGAPEIRALATAYNRMSDRLAELLLEQKRFAADASHQLRTPLTALRLRLETARELLTTDPEKAAERFEAAELEAERLNELVEALLLLSRGELDQGHVERVDLAAAAKAIVEMWQPLAEESQITLEYRGPETLEVLALDGAIEQIAGNLIDNALRASNAGQTVTVTVGFENRTLPVLHVLDEGTGMNEEAIAQAFNRFWRADSATAGTGIGLAIVKRLVEAGGGNIELRQRKPRGIDAVVIFRSA